MAEYSISAEEFRRWMPLPHAVATLTGRGWQTDLAITTLISRLSAGIFTAAAEHVIWKPFQGGTERQANCVIPSKHWNQDSEWLPDSTLWRTGDVYFDIADDDGHNITLHGRISYFGIRLKPTDWVSILDWRAGSDPSSIVSNPEATVSSGRRPSERWKPWIAELVAYIHEEGIPDGIGSQGQEELINAVSDRLSLRGEESLSRSTVQATVQAVLDRLRAEN